MTPQEVLECIWCSSQLPYGTNAIINPVQCLEDDIHGAKLLWLLEAGNQDVLDALRQLNGLRARRCGIPRRPTPRQGDYLGNIDIEKGVLYIWAIRLHGKMRSRLGRLDFLAPVCQWTSRFHLFFCPEHGVLKLDEVNLSRWCLDAQKNLKHVVGIRDWFLLDSVDQNGISRARCPCWWDQRRTACPMLGM